MRSRRSHKSIPCNTSRQLALHSETGEIIRSLEGLYSTVLADTLDKIGYRSQVVDPRIRPLYPEARLMGYAHTILGVPSVERPMPPYQVEFEVLDSLRPNEIVAYATQGGFGATWGELFYTRARLRGACGCLTDGMARDSRRMIEMKFPTFCAGLCPADTYGRVRAIAHGIPVICGGVEVKRGDLVFGDYDGVVIIPSEIIAETVRLSREKASTEDRVRTALMRGESAKTVYGKYGVM